MIAKLINQENEKSEEFGNISNKAISFNRFNSKENINESKNEIPKKEKVKLDSIKYNKLLLRELISL